MIAQMLQWKIKEMYQAIEHNRWFYNQFAAGPGVWWRCIAAEYSPKTTQCLSLF